MRVIILHFLFLISIITPTAYALAPSSRFEFVRGSEGHGRFVISDYSFDEDTTYSDSMDRYLSELSARREFIKNLLRVQDGATFYFNTTLEKTYTSIPAKVFINHFCNLYEFQGTVDFIPENENANLFRIKFIDYNRILLRKRKMDAFLGLVELCEKYGWFLEGTYDGYKYSDQTKLKYRKIKKRPFPDIFSYSEFTEARLNDYIKRAAKILKRSLALEKRGKVKKMDNRDKRRLFRSANILGIADSIAMEPVPYPLERIKTIYYVASGEYLGVIKDQFLENCPNVDKVYLIDPVLGYRKFSGPNFDYYELKDAGSEKSDGPQSLHYMNAEGRVVEIIIVPMGYEEFTPEVSKKPAILVVRTPGRDGNLSLYDGFYLKLIKDMKVGDLLFLSEAFIRAKGNVLEMGCMRLLPSRLFEFSDPKFGTNGELLYYYPSKEYVSLDEGWQIYEKTGPDGIGEQWKKWWNQNHQATFLKDAPEAFRLPGSLGC